MTLVLEGKVDAHLHRPVAGVHVAGAQEIAHVASGFGIDGVFRDNARDPRGCGARRKCESRRRLGVGREYVAKEVAANGPVEDVVNLPAELERFGVTPMELLEQGEIEINNARPRQDVAAGISSLGGAQGNLYEVGV